MRCLSAVTFSVRQTGTCDMMRTGESVSNNQIDYEEAVDSLSEGMGTAAPENPVRARAFANTRTPNPAPCEAEAPECRVRSYYTNSYRK